MIRGARALVLFGAFWGCVRGPLAPLPAAEPHTDAAVHSDGHLSPDGPLRDAHPDAAPDFRPPTPTTDARSDRSLDARLDAATGAGGHGGSGDAGGIGGGAPPDPCNGTCSAGTRCLRGSFTAGQVLATGQTPGVVLAADFNGDGVVDLVTGNRNSNQPDVFLGLGDGTFGPPKSFDAGAGQVALTVGDFDGDGRPDLAIADSFYLTTWNGTGDGTFRAIQSYEIGPFASWLTAADLDRDGRLDLAMTDFDHGDVTLFKGDGHDGFGPGVSIAVDDEPTYVAAVDLNHDANLDLVVVEPGSDDLTTLLGHGDGTFLSAGNADLLEDPTCGAVADFNGDGNLDVAVNDMGAIGILFGDGHGRWGTESRVMVVSGVAWITQVDLNADGKPDLVVGAVSSEIGSGNGYVVVLIGNGDGTFQQMQSIHTGSLPQSIVAADLNGDGHPDLAVADYLEDTVTIFLWSDGYRCQ
jgi:FG-GAP-like repeat